MSADRIVSVCGTEPIALLPSYPACWLGSVLVAMNECDAGSQTQNGPDLRSPSSPNEKAFPAKRPTSLEKNPGENSTQCQQVQASRCNRETHPNPITPVDSFR